MLEGTELTRSQAGTQYSQYLDNLIRTQVIPALQSQGLNVTYVPLMNYTGQNGSQTGNSEVPLVKAGENDVLASSRAAADLPRRHATCVAAFVQPTAVANAWLAASV